MSGRSWAGREPLSGSTMPADALEPRTETDMETPRIDENSPVTARILVVDDEQQLLRILTRYLTKLGYGVVSAASTEDAWEHIQAAPESYSLALIDATMSGMSSEELTRRILQANPTIRVIASSGYPITEEEFSAADPARVAFLHKPFSPDVLAEMVRSLLEGKASRLE